MPACRPMRLLLIGLFSLLALVPMGAAGSTPEREITQVDAMEVVPAAPDGPCAFAVTVETTGTIRRTFFFDQAGNLVKIIIVFSNFHFTATGNGQSITTASPDPIQVSIDADGSFTIAINGLMGHLIVPGEGLLSADVGRVVLFFEGPDDPEPDILQVTGLYNDEGDPFHHAFPGVCEALAL